MPFDSKKQQKWYHGTDQTYLDDEPSSSRKVKGKEEDLLSSKGQIEKSHVNLQSSGGKEIAPLVGALASGLVRGAATGAAKGVLEDSEVIGGIAGTLANTTGFAGDPDTNESPGADDKMGDEGLGDDEVPSKGFDLTSTEDLSVSGAPDSMPANYRQLKQSESIIIKTLNGYKSVPVFTANEHDYPSEPCGLCGTSYQDHKGKDHKFVEPKKGRKAGVAENSKRSAKESTGNCEFCEGTGKVTVEHLGIKECPRCDGEGSIGGDVMGQDMGMMDQGMMDPNMANQNMEPKKPRPMPYEKKPLSPSAMDKKSEEPDKENPFEKKEQGGESCKKCPNVRAYERWVDKHIHTLRQFASENETVGLMFSIPFKELAGENNKIKGTLAYAGASLNDRIYLPEELSKGHEKTLPLLINHSAIAGAEGEIHRLSRDVVDALENNRDYQVGEVTLTWHPDKLTLTYEGHIDNEFFAKEVYDMDMAVSLGIYYNSDSPKYCSTEGEGRCYTMIEGAEFREVSLVYHPGFPIATIEAVEAIIKKKAVEAQTKEKTKAVEAMSKKKEDGLLLFEGFIYAKKPDVEIEFNGETYQLISSEEEFKGLQPTINAPAETLKGLSKDKDTPVKAPEETKIEDLERKK